MKQIFTLLFLAAIQFTAVGQTIDFENFNLNTGEYLNGEDGSGGFTIDGFFFSNSYNPDWMSWSGWSISAANDTTTPGAGNQYSCISGEGSNNSSNYAVSFVNGHSIIEMPDDMWSSPLSVDVNNATYTYFSMLEGDNYAKKFGGIDGTDPDFLLLTIKYYSDGMLQEDSIDFYLADYRSADPAMDYIVNEWTTIDLSSFGDQVDSLAFLLYSTDVSSWGMNTPAYFCIDNINIDVVSDLAETERSFEVNTFPNPATDFLKIDWKESSEAVVLVYNTQGQLSKEWNIRTGLQTFEIANLPSGMYFMKIQTPNGWYTESFQKH